MDANFNGAVSAQSGSVTVTVVKPDGTKDVWTKVYTVNGAYSVDLNVNLS